MREEVVEETVIDVMLGLWNDGFRKMIIVNNHGHLWMLESAVQEFLKRYQLPGIFQSHGLAPGGRGSSSAPSSRAD